MSQPIPPRHGSSPPHARFALRVSDEASAWLVSGARWWLVPVALALVLRVAWATVGVPDYWGDGFHSWLMERLTLAHGWVYADYKGREVVWLPLFRYLGAAAMRGLGRYDLLPGHLVSLLAGSAACGVLAAAALRVTGSRAWAFVAGVMLALNPWHVAYSWMNMPEATGTLLVALVLLGLTARRTPAWLLPVAALAVLTRNDVTTVLALALAWVVWRRRWRDAALLAGGMVVGLAAWSAWTWLATGDPLWWLVRRAQGSTGDAAFWAARGLRPSGGPTAFGAMALQTFTPVVLLVWVGWRLARDRVWRAGLPAATGLLAVTGLGFAALVGVLQVRFFSYPDPRYLLAAVPSLTLLLVAVAAGAPRRLQGGLGTALGVLLALSLPAQLTTFPFRYLTLVRYERVGRFLASFPPGPGPIWMDAPVAIYYSGLDPERFRSSDQLAPWGLPAAEARDSAVAAVRRAGVRMILHDDVPFSRVPELWPEMAEGRPFTRDGLRFTPVYRYAPFTAHGPDREGPVARLRDRVRARVEGRYAPVSLWRVEDLR